MKSLRLLVILAMISILPGCAITPQGSNILTGAGLGALFGAAAGDNSASAKRGAIIGGVLGALVPTNQQQQQGWQQQQPQGWQQNGLPPGASCPAGSAWDGRGCLRNGNIGQQSVVQNFPTFPEPRKGWCNNPYRVNSQGQFVYNGGFPC